MQDVLTMLNAIHRPRLMMRAARIGAENYRRATDLRRVLGYGFPTRPAAAILKLMELEADLEDQRKAVDASYSLTGHLDVLIAMVGEARMLRASQTSPEVT